MKSESATINVLQPFGLLASALSGRVLQVAHGVPGEPAWTDGRTVFVDATLNERELLVELIVQASLLSAGSLAPDILRKIARDSNLARRYLAIEGHRALAANKASLPGLAFSLLDRKVAARSDSPSSSLATALSRDTIADPPRSFGVIRSRKFLAANDGARHSSGKQEQVHAPRQQRNQTLAELEDDNDDDDNGSSRAVDMFSVAGGGGLFGKWLQRLLKAVRQGNASGSPGIDAPTHRIRTVTPSGGKVVYSTATVGEVEDVANQVSGTMYPEWDMRQRSYRPNWCTVQEIEPPQKEITQSAPPDSSSLRRPLARIGLGLDRCRRQAQGDDIDIDAAIEARVEILAGSIPDESIYVDSLRRRRDLSVLLLLDISGSVAEPGGDGKTVHEQQRAAAAALTSALYHLGDRVALYAFNSQGRSLVQLVPVKRFDEPFNSIAMQRLHSLAPGAYSRLGAAIRHGAGVLEEHGGTSKRLLVVLSDGLAYDHGYERDYGAADARRALGEARRRGTGSVCLTIGASTDAESLQHVFGSAAHATISRLSQVGEVIGPLFQSALRSAEVRRRVS